MLKIWKSTGLGTKFRPHQRFLSGRVAGRNDRSVRKIERGTRHVLLRIIERIE